MRLSLDHFSFSGLCQDSFQRDINGLKTNPYPEFRDRLTNIKTMFSTKLNRREQ